MIFFLFENAVSMLLQQGHVCALQIIIIVVVVIIIIIIIITTIIIIIVVIVVIIIKSTEKCVTNTYPVES